MPSPKRQVGRYQIVRQIGRGGMATVYLARQTQLERNVALKELSSFHASAPEFAERFLRESRLAGSLNHPNIVTVFEYFEEGGTPYIAMEYVTRGSLRPYVGRLSLAQFAGAMEGILAGLAHAETYGIVHRDLKPENIMVTGEGRVKITDFGIAKATQTAGTGAFLTATGTTVGTPTYMAPEQAMAQEIGMWTDLYSVGVMAYEHVVGRVPFYDTEAPMVILMRHVNEPIPPATEINPQIDPELSAWIDRLLVKEPTKRTQTAVGAWDELEEIILQLLGPRWRREARLPEHIAALDTPRPLTPAPFESMRMATPDPMVGGPTPEQTPGAPSTQAPAPAEPEPAYMTFGRAAESVAPGAAAAAAAGAAAAGAAEAAAPHVAAPAAAAAPPQTAQPEAVAPPSTAAPSTEEPPAVQDSATTPEAPPAPQDDSLAPEASDYMTFGRAPEVAPPPAEEKPPEAAPPARPDTVAPAAAEAAYLTFGRTPEPATKPEPAPESTAPPTPESTAPTEPESSAPPAPEAAAPPAVAPEAAEHEHAQAAGSSGATSPPPAVDEPAVEEPAVEEPVIEEPAEAEPEPEHEAEAEPEPEPERQPEPEAARPAARPPHARTAPRPEVARRRIAAVAIVGAVAAAAIGFLIAHGSSSKSQPPAPALIGSDSSGPVQISLLSGWASHKIPTSANLGLSNELAVAPTSPTGGLLVMGTATKTDATLLPTGFVSTLQGPPTAQTVTLGHTQFYRYLNVTPRGTQNPETAYAVPTTAGSVVAICQPQGAGTTFLSDCERIIGTLQLSSASVLGLGPSSSYAAGLKTAIGKLNGQQSSAGARLSSAKKPSDQANAASDLASAFHQAGSTVQKLQPGPAATSTNAAIAIALRNVGAGYAAMSQAAAHNNGSAYNAARRKIAAATADLRAAFNRLSQLGYTAT